MHIMWLLNGNIESRCSGINILLYDCEDTNEKDFEDDFTNHKGAWCPMCDGFNYYDETEKHNFTVILEKAKGMVGS